MADEAGTRLRRAREAAGYATAKEAAQAMSWAVSTYLGHENGSRGFPAKRAVEYSQAFHVSEECLLFAKGPEPNFGLDLKSPIYLREWRKHRGLVQQDVIDRLKAMNDPLLPSTAASLSRLENGKQQYSQRVLEALSTVYGCDVLDLLGKTPLGEAHLQATSPQSREPGPHYRRDWRTHRGLTQEQLAEAVGTTHQQIGYLEKGARGLTAEWLAKLAPILRTTPGSILDRRPTDNDGVLEVWSQVPEESRPQALRILRTFIN